MDYTRYGDLASEILATGGLDFRTTEDIEEQTEELAARLRETITGLPARPGVIR